MTSIDEHNIIYIQKHSKKWFNKNFPLDVVDDFYSTPVKTARKKNPPKLKLKLPISKGLIDTNIYDIGNNLIDYRDVVSESKIVATIKLLGLRFLKQQVICEWTPLQLKVYQEPNLNNKVQGYLINNNLLTDDEEDNVEDTTITLDNTENTETVASESVDTDIRDLDAEETNVDNIQINIDSNEQLNIQEGNDLNSESNDINLQNQESNIIENQESDVNWTIEDNLDIEVKKILTELKEGDISKEIKVNDGYKIFKLNRKRIFGYEMLKYSFIKISSFEIENLDFSKFSSISCSDDEFNINNNISAIKLTDVVANEMVSVYLEKLEKLENGKFSTVISHDNQFSVLKLCDKKNELNQVEKRNKIQNNLYAKKFNQLASTFIANLRKNANIKYFNK